jgi:hypothetical protein
VDKIRKDRNERKEDARTKIERKPLEGAIGFDLAFRVRRKDYLG